MAEVVSGLGEPVFPVMADAVAVAAPAQAGDDGTAKVEEIIEKLRAESLALHEKIFAEKTTLARAFLDNVHLQRDMVNVVKEMKEAAQPLIVEQVNREIGAVVERLMKGVLLVTMMAAEHIGTLAAWLKRDQKKTSVSRKEKATATPRLHELRESKKRADYERDVLEAKLQACLAQPWEVRERNRPCGKWCWRPVRPRKERLG